MSKGLILDTSTAYLAIGLEIDGEIVDKVMIEALRKQSEFSLTMIKDIMDKNNLKAKDLDYVCVTTGPGSYTGVRIAMCIAKMLAVSLKIKLYSISTLKAYLGSLDDGLVLIDARSKSAFVYGVLKGKVVLDEQLIKLEDLDASKFTNIINDGQLINKDKNVCDIISNIFALKDQWILVKNPHLLVPNYLKD